MTGCTAVTPESRRSPLMSARIAVAVAAVVVLGAACGSDATEPADAPPTPGTAAAAAPSAAAEATPPAGDPAADAPPEVPPQPATPPVPQPQPAPSPQPAPQPAPSPQPPVQRDTSGARTFPAAEVWEGLRQCQSQGDYGFVHPSGEYFGAYQFTVATWDRLAAQRYQDLVGVLPSEADSADQDRMAYYLWIESGHDRWPACSHVFTGDPPTEAAATVTGDGGASPSPAADPGEPSDVATTDEGQVEGAPVEPAPGDDEALPAPPPGAEAEESGETGVTATTSVADLAALDIDPAMQPAIPPDVPGFPTEEQWEALRMCESSGNYGAFSRAGPYYGAYQFDQPTWDFVASRNYPRLAGVQPWHATPQDQTRMAYRLWEERGDQPWPICGRHLRPGA